MIELCLNLLILQALMGAFDTLYHHEFAVALPRRAGAGCELAIHASRALLYALVFIGLAWFEWRGGWTLVLVGVVLIEVGLTLWDFVIEDRSRLLPASERVTHTLLAINGGAAFALLALELPGWFAQPGGLYGTDYGWRSWFLTAAGVGVGLSGLRDGFAAWVARRLDLRLGLSLGGHRRLLLSGGTGFIGSALCRELLSGDHELTLITRNPVAAALQFGGRVRALRSPAALDAAERFDAVVNLAGAPVVGWPWTERRRAVLRASRFDTTRELMDFVRRARQRPAVWVQASAVGFYGSDSDRVLDEASPPGSGFAATLCRDWEGMTTALEVLGVRRVVLRFGLVFGRSGGSLPMMLLSYRFGAGAVLGNGRQRVSWIHLEDLLEVIALAIKDESMSGVVNAVAPDSPTFNEFAVAVGRQLQRPVWLTLPAAPLRAVLGEMASLFVDGPRVLPRRLTAAGFEFRFPDLRGALMDLS